MTNREKLLKYNEYDILVSIQNYFLENSNCNCILETLTSEYIPCRSTCKECIQKWLNSDAKRFRIEEVNQC